MRGRALRYLVAGGLAMLPAAGSAQGSAYTTPRGIYVVKLTGKLPGENQHRTHLGLQLLTEPVYQGLVATVSGDWLTLQGFSDYPVLQHPGQTYYMQVLNGTGRGFISDIVEFGQNGLRCAAALGSWMGPNTLIRIHPHPSLADIFGSDNRFALTSGTSAALADNVVVWDAAAQQERVYYYHSVRERWEQQDINADAGAAPLKYPYGIYVIRRSEGNLRMTLSGMVSGAPILLPVRPGVNVFSLPVNLSSSLANLLPATSAFPVAAGENSSQGDLITLEEPSSGLQRGPFHLSSRGGTTGWHEVGVNAGSGITQPLDYLSTLVLRRNGPAGHIRVEGNLDSGSGFVPPANPDQGEVPLTGTLSWPGPILSGYTLAVEVSTDLHNWSVHPDFTVSGNVATVDLPAGQGRAFYRLRISPPL